MARRPNIYGVRMIWMWDESRTELVLAEMLPKADPWKWLTERLAS